MTAGAFYLFRTAESVDQLGPGLLSFLKHTVSERGPQFVKRGDYTDKRTLSQNDMHCGLCRDMAEAMKAKTGLDYDCEYFRTKTKRKFGVKLSQVDPDTGKEEPYLMSTTNYSKKQFGVLIDGTLAWAFELGIPLADPRPKP